MKKKKQLKSCCPLFIVSGFNELYYVGAVHIVRLLDRM